MTTKKTKDYDDDVSGADALDAAGPAPTGDVIPADVVVVYDGANPVWIRLDAVQAFYGLPADPDTAIHYRVILSSGTALLVTATLDARAQLMRAISQ